MLGTNCHWSVRVFSVSHPLWHGASVYNGHLRRPVRQTCCRAFSSGAVITSFNDLDLSRLGFNHPPFLMPGERSNRKRNRNPKSQWLRLSTNYAVFNLRMLYLCIRVHLTFCTRNIHVKYRSSSNRYSKVLNKVKKFKK